MGGRQASFGLFVRKTRVGCAELQVRDQSVKTIVAAVDNDKSAFLNILRSDGQTHGEIFLQSRRRSHSQF